MARKSPENATQEFRAMTERIAQKRIRVRNEFLPELTAWLVLQGRTYTRARVHLEQMLGRTSNETVRGQIASLKAHENAIEQLVRCLPDPWSALDWIDVSDEVARVMGIHVREPLPEQLRTVPAAIAGQMPTHDVPAKG